MSGLEHIFSDYPSDPKTSSDPKASSEPKPRGPKFAAPPGVDDAYLQKVVCGLELIFSDYAHHDAASKAWSTPFYRTINGEEKCKSLPFPLTTNPQEIPMLINDDLDIHLSVLISHRALSTLRPQCTQTHITNAITAYPSPLLETTSSHPSAPITHVRRKPSTYPAPFMPVSLGPSPPTPSPEFWHARTIYVEPSQRFVTSVPAALAWHIKNDARMREKWLPVQAVLYDGLKGEHLCAWVVLSGDVEVGGMFEKWDEARRKRNAEALAAAEDAAKFRGAQDKGEAFVKLPLQIMKGETGLEDWMILTRKEFYRRDEEYARLVNGEKLEDILAGAPKKKKKRKRSHKRKRKAGKEEGDGGKGDGEEYGEVGNAEEYDEL
jgi:hypothetical protein